MTRRSSLDITIRGEARVLYRKVNKRLPQIRGVKRQTHIHSRSSTNHPHKHVQNWYTLHNEKQKHSVVERKNNSLLSLLELTFRSPRALVRSLINHSLPPGLLRNGHARAGGRGILVNNRAPNPYCRSKCHMEINRVACASAHKATEGSFCA